MASFQKTLQRFFVYFFTSVSVLVVILGIQRAKQGDTPTLATTPRGSDDESGDSTTQSMTRQTVAGQTTITAKGKGYQTPWGPLATAIKVKDGKIVAVEIATLPDSPPSVYAEPYLIDQVLRSGSADIQGVSGATITSRAFVASLESALAVAAAQGASVAPTTSASSNTFAAATGIDTPATSALRPTSRIASPTAKQTTATKTTTPSGSVSGTFTGAAYQTPWGNAVVSVTFTNGKITAVAMPQVPNSPPSVEAKPFLIDQTLKAGGANIQGVSGATYASIAFKSSLESAIVKASADGTVATPVVNTTGTAQTQTTKPTVSRTYHDDDDGGDNDDWGDDEDEDWDD
ncbi:MAG: FMN-binding protein [Minisyncoccia bacterium]